MMKAGKYYVGDLCYVLADRWDEFCDLTIKDHDCLDGEFELADGTRFAVFGTMYGDGQYADQHGNDYPVDSGSIGCVLVEDIKMGEASKNCGNIFDFDKDFEPSVDKSGLITFAHVTIDTDPRHDYSGEA